MGENNSIVGNLSLTSAPNGDITQIFVTPMNINTQKFEEGVVHTYVRTYSNGQWGEWNEQKSAEIPESLQVFNSLYLNSNGQMKTQPIGKEQLSTELKDLLGQLQNINELKNRLSQLENKATFLDTKIDRVQRQGTTEEVDKESNNIESFQLYPGTLSTANNEISFNYNVQFVDSEHPVNYNIIFNFIEGGDYLTLSNHDTVNKRVTFTISSNTPNSQFYNLEAQLFEEGNDVPSAYGYQSGSVKYTNNNPTYNSNWSVVLTVNSSNQNNLIQDNIFYVDADINTQNAGDEINISSYSWEIISGDGIEIQSGSKSSRCYFTIKETSTTQQTAVIECTLKDSHDVTKTGQKQVSFVYTTSEEPSYFLKIQDNYGTNMEDGIIMDKHFSLRYVAYHFNTQNTYYGMSVWTIIKGPVIFDPEVSGDSFQLTDDAKGGDEIIIQVAPSKSKQNTDRITLHVISGYNVPLEDFEIDSGNISEFEGSYLQLAIRTTPNIDNLKACTWELIEAPGKAATINQSGLITINPIIANVPVGIRIGVKATSLVDPTKSSIVYIKVKYADTSELNNNKLSYINICYNYGGNYIDFHAQGMYQNPNTGENVGLRHLEDTNLTWEFVDNAVSEPQLQAACSNSSNPKVYQAIIRSEVPIEQANESSVNIVDQNDETYQVNEVLWYDYDSISKLPALGGSEGSTIGEFLGNSANTSHPILIDSEGITNTINFRNIEQQSAVLDDSGTVPTRALKRGGGGLPYFENEDDPDNLQLHKYRVMLPNTDNYHSFILKCTYEDSDGNTVSKTESFRFFAFSRYPYPPEIDRLQTLTSGSDHLIFDDSYPSQINLWDYFEYPNDVLDDGAPSLVFDNPSSNLCYVNWNGITTLRNGVSGSNTITIYQPYHYEDKTNDTSQPYYKQSKLVNIEVQRSNSPLETDFVIKCRSTTYIGNVAGAPLDGVTITSRDTSNNVLSGVTYQIVGGSQYCSVNATGTEMRIFDTGKEEKEITIKGTLGSKVSYATFKVKLDPTAPPSTGYDQDNENY